MSGDVVAGPVLAGLDPALVERGRDLWAAVFSEGPTDADFPSDEYYQRVAEQFARFESGEDSRADLFPEVFDDVDEEG